METKNTYFVQVNNYMTPARVRLTKKEAHVVAYVLMEIARIDPDALVEISDDCDNVLYDNYNEWVKNHE